VRSQFGGHNLQGGFFPLLEKRFNLLADGFVDTFIRDLLFPRVEKMVLFDQTGEGPASERSLSNSVRSL
jgi:hypothetical protein